MSIQTFDCNINTLETLTYFCCISITYTLKKPIAIPTHVTCYEDFDKQHENRYRKVRIARRGMFMVTLLGSCGRNTFIRNSKPKFMCRVYITIETICSFFLMIYCILSCVCVCLRFSNYKL